MSCRTFAALTVERSRSELVSGARGADAFAGAKGMCLRQGASRSEVEGGEDGHSPIGRSRSELQVRDERLKVKG